MSVPPPPRTTRSDRRTVTPPIAAAALLLAFLGIWILLGTVGFAPLPLDAWWISVVGLEPGSGTYLFAVVLAVVGGTAGSIVVAGVVVVILLLNRKHRAAFVVAVTLATGGCAVWVIKQLVLRPRPAEAMIEAGGTSFPSGHSMASAALTTTLVLLLAHHLDRADGPAGVQSTRRTRVALILAVVGGTLYTATMMWSRTALHVHWLSDTLAGACLGVATALLVAGTLPRGFSRRPQHRRASPQARQDHPAEGAP